MSLSDLILFPHIPKEIYNEYLKKNRSKVTNGESFIKAINNLFISSKKGNRLSEVILYDFYLTLNHESIFKDNITGKRLEQRLSTLFALSTGDEIAKSNPKIESLLRKEEINTLQAETLDLIKSNYREKGDLFFYNSAADNIYKISLKSLVPKNIEINFGAFEFTSVIKNVAGLEPLLDVKERNRTITRTTLKGNEIKNIGTGSQAQLKNLFDYVKEMDLEKPFIKTFETLLNGIFKDDFFIYIKDNEYFKAYFLENQAFIQLLLENIKNGFTNLRMEGNALRFSGFNQIKERSSFKLEEKKETVLPHFNDISLLLEKSNLDKIDFLKNFITN